MLEPEHFRVKSINQQDSLIGLTVEAQTNEGEGAPTLIKVSNTFKLGQMNKNLAHGFVLLVKRFCLLNIR